MFLQLLFAAELHDSLGQSMDPGRGVSAWARLLLLPLVQRHGSADSFLMVGKNQLEGHLLFIIGHMVAASRLNAMPFNVRSLILEVQQ
jgi:hypothetical protein